MTELQIDSQHPLAAVLTPYLLDVEVQRDYYRAARTCCASGTSTRTPDSGAAAYFNVVWRNLLEDTFHDELPEDLWPDGGDRWVAAVTELLDDPRNGWWDDLDTDDVVEDRDDILHRALLDARDEMTVTAGARTRTSGAGASCTSSSCASRRSATRASAPVEWLVNRGGWEVGGGSAAVTPRAGTPRSRQQPYVVT